MSAAENGNTATSSASADIGSMPPAPEPPHEWHRLNAWMIIVRPIHEIAGLIPVIVVLLVFGRGDTQRLWWTVAAIALLLLRGLVHWLRTRYRITETQVELHTGLVSRQLRTVPRDRIRTVATTARFGHRMFGLSEVRIGTGEHEQKRRDPFSLDAVTAAEAERLRKVLLRKDVTTSSASDSPHDGSDVDKSGIELARLDLRWLRYAPLTLSGLTSVGVLIGIGFRLVDETNGDLPSIGPIHAVLDWMEHSALAEVVLVAMLVVVGMVSLGSLLGYVFQFWNYRLTRETDGTLRVRRGLFTTRSVSIEEARLRGAAVRQPLLLRIGGGARVAAITTGLDRKNESSLLLPPAPLAEAQRITAAVLGIESSPAADLVRHPAAALRRRLLRAVGGVALLATVLGLAAALGWPAWPWITTLALMPFAVALAVDRFRTLGHGLTERYLITRWGSLRRETTVLQRSGIIGWKLRRSFFQRRAGLLTLTATTAAGHGAYYVTDVAEEDAVAFADRALPGLLAPMLVAADVHRRSNQRRGLPHAADQDNLSSAR